MYKVIVFGTGKTSRVVESGLNNEVNIIAYCDNDKSKWWKKINGKEVVPPEELLNEKYDFIIIASQYNESINEQLLKLGIEQNKIFQFFKFSNLMNNVVLWNLYSLEQQMTDVEMLITGISYTQKGIIINKFSKKTFNLACASQDLYYDYNLIKYILKKYNNKFRNLKYVIIGLCYYSFEYDMSLSSMKNRVCFYYEILGLKHNISINIKEVLEYKEKGKKIAEKIFKLRENGDIELDWFVSKQDAHPLNEKEGENQARIDGDKNYPETVKENVKIFYDYLDMLYEHDIKPIVVVFPTSKYYSDYFPERLKKQFYEIINSAKEKRNFQFIDYFNSDEFINEDFYDVSHLNNNGAAKFSSILDDIIEW